MPTTATATRNAGKHMPIDPKAAMKAGERAPRTHTRKKDENAVYVQALLSAEGFHKKAFYVEMAVCLAFYAAHEDATAKTKKLLRPVYEKAGYDCKTAAGEDYKTVQRRISVASDLFTYLGAGETVKDWVEDAQGQRAIERVAHKLEELGMDNIQVVKAKVGSQARTRKRKAQEAANAAVNAAAQATGTQAQAAPAPLAQADAATQEAMKEIANESQQRQELSPERILRTTHLELRIPMETTKEELMALAQNIMVFAASLATAQAAVAA